ncbi:RNA-directed DNA polymerase from mobile element jockey [Trichonephila clavipes]|nr:RNA-directed DNA polymerase from mobile element jockey [Trichonephila clavipes]
MARIVHHNDESVRDGYIRNGGKEVKLLVKYLGLHIDSRLMFKKHIDYLSEKFWGRISLAISLIGRRSPLSLDNKVILYKQILRPVITYGSPVWGAAAATHMKKIQWLEHRTPDRKTRVRCPMPPNTLRVHTEYVLVKSVGPKSCGLNHERRDWRIFPSPSVRGGGDRGRVAIYRPFGELRPA